MLELLKSNKDTVAAWINGHNHAGTYEQRDGIHYLTLKGMLDTKENAFATIEIYEDAIKVDGHYREPDRRLPLEKQ